MNGCIWLWVAVEVCVMQFGDTPLGAACGAGQWDVVKLLIEKCGGLLDVNKPGMVSSGFVIAVVCTVWRRAVLCSSSWWWQ